MKKLLFLIVLVSAFFFSGCVDLTFPGADEGTVRVVLTDAVIPIEEIDSLMVRIESIKLYGSEDVPPEEYEPLVIVDEPFEVDILTLVGTTFELPDTTGVVGVYNQLRIEVSAATMTANEIVYPVTVNSGSLKINNLGLDINEGSVTNVVLDFDLSKSLKINGQWEEIVSEAEISGEKKSHEDKVHMTPVIHVRHGSLLDVTGIASSDQLPLLVALFPEGNGEALTTFTHIDNPIWEEGEFRFCKVGPGEYRLEFFDNYREEGFSVDESESRYQSLSVTVADKDVDLGTIVLVEK
ncbi:MULTISPECIES: DUF4382 domain-containing protein [unclassified Mesotoga]|uniref:DUF4382 domain-containing protein n=1 Tax=unclassified Mesotoga TaxID=1184398 RepID=UPI000EF19B5F|nr:MULTISPECIES: DUF4382 domain-containing protein [unclassified Mesotoga]MDD4825586.1 DUF4382 domain-containing protein [Mesotoga sp.]RLL81503.1 hypothetical protein Y697_12255 [Mesotoga sp. BH458_6_3_2_1]